MNRKAIAEVEAREAQPVGARLVAMKDFRYLDTVRQISVPVRHGDVLDAAALRRSGCNIAKLMATKFVRREDE